MPNSKLLGACLLLSSLILATAIVYHANAATTREAIERYQFPYAITTMHCSKIATATAKSSKPAGGSITNGSMRPVRPLLVCADAGTILVKSCEKRCVSQKNAANVAAIRCWVMT